MNTTICDACGKNIKTASEGGKIKTHDPRSFLMGDPECEYDLCSDCYRIIKNVLLIATDTKNNILKVVDWTVTKVFKEKKKLEVVK